MRIYVACLASYNNGVLHGRWVEASSDVAEMQEEVSAMLRESTFPNVTVTHPETGEAVPSAEEFAIHDMEGMPSYFGEYCGIYDSFREYADEAADEMISAERGTSKRESMIERYFDYAAWARDLQMDMTTVDLKGGRVVVFHS